MNIGKFHPDVEHIVAMAGFRSLEAMLMQRMPALLKYYRPNVYALEEQMNPEYVTASARDSLSITNSKVLIIHSEDDPVVSCKIHFDPLAAQLRDKENIKFLKVKNKGHNPNYSDSAVKYLREYIKISKRKAKKLKTAEQKQEFINSFDWYKMTEQDEKIWKQIFALLDS